jgi:hypothetical protein
LHLAKPQGDITADASLCNAHSQRRTCPRSAPHMCGATGCAGGQDHCCSATLCQQFGGLRQCAAQGGLFSFQDVGTGYCRGGAAGDLLAASSLVAQATYFDCLRFCTDMLPGCLGFAYRTKDSRCVLYYSDPATVPSEKLLSKGRVDPNTVTPRATGVVAIGATDPGPSGSDHRCFKRPAT